MLHVTRYFWPCLLWSCAGLWVWYWSWSWWLCDDPETGIDADPLIWVSCDGGCGGENANGGKVIKLFMLLWELWMLLFLSYFSNFINNPTSRKVITNDKFCETSSDEVKFSIKSFLLLIFWYCFNLAKTLWSGLDRNWRNNCFSGKLFCTSIKLIISGGILEKMSSIPWSIVFGYSKSRGQKCLWTLWSWFSEQVRQ